MSKKSADNSHRLSEEPLKRIAELAPNAYVVGGAVRDLLLGRPAYDLDLAIPEGGCRLARHLANELGGAYYALDPERDVGRVIIGKLIIDVARFRGGDLEADLLARDFTINAMATPTNDLSRLIDPLGGAADLEKGILRQCTSNSIASDPIRAIRAVRQAIQLSLQIEEKTLAAARRARRRLLEEGGSLAQPERVRDEFVKQLSLPMANQALWLMTDLGLLEAILPQARVLNIPAVEQLDRLLLTFTDYPSADALFTTSQKTLLTYRQQLRECLGQTFADGRPLSALLRLVALTHDESRPHPAAKEFAPRLRLSNEERSRASRIETAFRCIQALVPPLTPREIHRYYREVEEAGIDGILLATATFKGEPPELWRQGVALPLLKAFFKRHQQIVAPPPLVTGRDLIQHLGLSSGPLIGELLEQLLEEQVEGTIRTRNQALRFAKRLMKTSGNSS